VCIKTFNNNARDLAGAKLEINITVSACYMLLLGCRAPARNA
jgi:hypothetical protein